MGWTSGGIVLVELTSGGRGSISMDFPFPLYVLLLSCVSQTSEAALGEGCCKKGQGRQVPVHGQYFSIRVSENAKQTDVQTA